MPTSPSLGVSVSPQWNELLEVSAETPQQSLETSDHIIMGHIRTDWTMPPTYCRDFANSA